MNPADVDNRCLDHDATPREELRSLVRNQVDSVLEKVTALREQVKNAETRFNVDFGQHEERLTILGGLRDVARAHRDEIATLQQDVSSLLEDVAVEKATSLELTDGFAWLLSRMEAQMERLSSNEVADVVWTTLPVGSYTGGVLPDDEEGGHADSNDYRRDIRDHSRRNGERSSKQKYVKKVKKKKVFNTRNPNQNLRAAVPQTTRKRTLPAVSRMSQSTRWDALRAGGLSPVNPRRG